MADNTPDETSTATISLLDARLRRVEHLLYGPSAEKEASLPPVVHSLASLERRFSALVSNARVYADLLKIYRDHPSLFHSPPPEIPPTQLNPDAIRAAVLSYSSAFPAIASSLNAAVVDTPVPDAALSAQLVALMPRMQQIDASQRALEAEVAQLRSRSESFVRQYYEDRALAPSKFVANLETRLERAEGRVRRLAKNRQAEAEAV